MDLGLAARLAVAVVTVALALVLLSWGGWQPARRRTPGRRRRPHLPWVGSANLMSCVAALMAVTLGGVVVITD